MKDTIPRWHSISNDFLTHLVVVGTKRFYGVTGWKHRTIIGPKILVEFGVGVPVTRAKYHLLSFGLPHFRLARVDVKGMMSKTVILEYDYLQGALDNAPDIDKVRVELPVKKSGAEKMRSLFLKLSSNARTKNENLRGFFTYQRF